MQGKRQKQGNSNSDCTIILHFIFLDDPIIHDENLKRTYFYCDIHIDDSLITFSIDKIYNIHVLYYS